MGWANCLLAHMITAQQTLTDLIWIWRSSTANIYTTKNTIFHSTLKYCYNASTWNSFRHYITRDIDLTEMFFCFNFDSVTSVVQFKTWSFIVITLQFDLFVYSEEGTSRMPWILWTHDIYDRIRNEHENIIFFNPFKKS